MVTGAPLARTFRTRSTWRRQRWSAGWSCPPHPLARAFSSRGMVISQEQARTARSEACVTGVRPSMGGVLTPLAFVGEHSILELLQRTIETARRRIVTQEQAPDGR